MRAPEGVSAVDLQLYAAENEDRGANHLQTSVSVLVVVGTLTAWRLPLDDVSLHEAFFSHVITMMF